ncbi:hypothetical protein FGB62_288g02 [Gracilaria domingensis]|nr:hypothetical protein FGB62_288g02 [Gracilaria domingensis]
MAPATILGEISLASAVAGDGALATAVHGEDAVVASALIDSVLDVAYGAHVDGIKGENVAEDTESLEFVAEF